jgi:myo-inositol-1(or 4)-monophosphatase
MGSVAYMLAWVAAGLADAAWTLSPKHEWDVAAGIALVNAAGGFAQGLDNSFLRFNNWPCILPNLLEGGPYLAAELSSYLQHYNDATETIVMSPSNANPEG